MPLEKFTYFWEIKNPQYCTLKTGQFMDSPKFCVPQFWNTEWYLRLFPQGKCEVSKGNTSCFMRRGNESSGPDIVQIKYKLNLSSGERTYSSNLSFEKNSSWGYSSFLPCPLEAYQKSIMIIWEMHCQSMHCDNLETSEEEISSSKSDLAFPIKCFTQTKILYETKSIQRYIDPLVSGTCSRMTIPLDLQEKYPAMILNLQSNAQNIIHVNIGLTDGAFDTSFVGICRIRLTNTLGHLLHSIEEKHKFIAEGEDNWGLAKSINKSHFKTHLSDSSLHQVNLTGDFGFSTGETVSEIVRVECIKILRNFVPNNEYILSNEMFRLYKEKKLCDFVLKVGNDTFAVHRVVLSAASPVFAAMFTNEMTEKESNVVDIVDVDKDTVEKMVYFMYTGSVKELEYESARKLYIAGDKYQISPLQDLVRNTIIDQINSNTICAILHMADAHNDDKLLNKAMGFFKLNKTTILNSSNWETFAKENANLAVKSLTEICLLNKRKRQD